MVMKFLVLLILVLSSFKVVATQQIEETLDLGGVRFNIEEFPLESHPKYTALVEKVGSGVCSASWRGYKGIWSIGQDKLYLFHVIKDPCGEKSEYLDPAELMGMEETDVVAQWYTGKITFRISRKSYLNRSSEGVSGETYEAVVYQIKNGNVLSRSIEKVEYLWQ